MIPPALSARGLIAVNVPFSLYYLASFGPMLSALILSALTSGASGVRQLLSGLLKWRVGWGYVAFSVLAPFAFFFIAVLLTRIVTGDWPQISLLGEVDYLPYLGFIGALGVWLLTYGLGEEVGWRALRPAAPAALTLRRDGRGGPGPDLGLLAPAGLLLSGYLHRDGRPWFSHLRCFGGFCLGAADLAVQQHPRQPADGGAVPAIFNWLSVSEAGGPYAAIIMGAAAVFWAVRVLKVYGPQNLSPGPKVII